MRKVDVGIEPYDLSVFRNNKKAYGTFAAVRYDAKITLNRGLNALEYISLFIFGLTTSPIIIAETMRDRRNPELKESKWQPSWGRFKSPRAFMDSI
jgi:hypothetical protein